MNTPRTTEDEVKLKAAMEIVARHLAGNSGEAFGALELLYTTATTTEHAKWISGHLFHVGDVVKWNHGKGTRSGVIAQFYSPGKVYVRFLRGTGCGIQNHRIRSVP